MKSKYYIVIRKAGPTNQDFHEGQRYFDIHSLAYTLEESERRSRDFAKLNSTPSFDADKANPIVDISYVVVEEI